MEKIARNDPCPCGSGKKYKKCCIGKEIEPKGKIVEKIVTSEGLTIPTDWKKTPEGWITPDGWKLGISDEPTEDLIAESMFQNQMLMEMYGVKTQEELDKVLKTKTLVDIEKDFNNAKEK